MTPLLISTGLLDPQSLITGAGAWALAIVCAAVFAETGLLVGFFLPGDTLLFFTGVLTLSGAIREPLWLVILLVGLSAALGDQLGYTIGRRTGPAVFERRESGVFSRKSVTRTQTFFDRFGPAAVTIARFVPVVRTFAPVAGIHSVQPRGSRDLVGIGDTGRVLACSPARSCRLRLAVHRHRIDRHRDRLCRADPDTHDHGPPAVSVSAKSRLIPACGAEVSCLCARIHLAH
jgi:membrane protein YqaA with SNARE-associated domain